jgi:RNA polymerase sigma-70 factor (ECF subfamily)
MEMSDGTTSPGGPRAFPVTQWTAVLAAGGAPSQESAAALERLCGDYWYPLYAFARRSGHCRDDAKDLTQEFFARLVGGNWIAHADRHRGRFRSFLLMAMKRFMAKEWDKARTIKRGGQVRFVPLEYDTAETRYGLEPADTQTPEDLFEKQWAMTLLTRVLGRLREQYAREGKRRLFEALEPCLIGERATQPYARLSEELGLTEGAVKMAVKRLRESYRVLLKEQVGQTVASPAEVDDELRHLFRTLARR